MGRYELDPDSGLFMPRQREIVKPRHCSMAAMQQALVMAAGATGPTDPNWSNVVLLMHCDGTNGQTTTVDSSSQNHGITLTGSLALTTTSPKFGATCLGFDTSSGVAVAALADSDDWHFGSGQFTVECWICLTSSPGSLNTPLLAQWQGGAGGSGWWFGQIGSDMSFLWSNSGSGGSFFGGTWSKTQNVWTHIAADRDASNVLRIYQDGAVVASQTVTDTFFNSTSILEVGDNSGPTASVRFPGRMDEIRITKGVARYAGAFTPPTAAFPNS